MSKAHTLIIWAAAALVFGTSARAAEYITQEEPAPVSAEDLESPIGVAFEEEVPEVRFLMPGLKGALSGLPAFFRDTQFRYASRAYSFDRRDSSEDKARAQTAGGRLEYQSGEWNNFSLNAGWYGSWQIDTKNDGGDTGLLAPGQKNIQVWGEANVQYQFTRTPLEGSTLTAYRQRLKLPYINEHDIRMVPTTHEGFVLAREGDSAFDYVLGHLNKFKKFDSEEFVHMSRAAGAPGTDKGVTMFGARPINSDAFMFGAINYVGWDTFNTFYTEASYHTVFDGGLDLRLSGQFTDQRSIGDELVGDFDTWHAGVQAAMGWRGAVVKLAGSMTSDDERIRKPWGGSPSYLSIQRFDFDRAGEKAVLFGLSYNTEYFSSLGLSSFINIAHGNDAENPLTGEDLPNRTEYNLTIDYKPPRGPLKGLWIRARGAWFDVEGDGESSRDYRLIINYEIPFL